MKQSILHWKNAAIISSLLLTGCGGGGSGGSSENVDSTPTETPTTTTEPVTVPNYDPDSTRLSSEATTSDELYVEPKFMFGFERTVNFYFGVNDSIGMPMTDTLITVYAVPATTENWDDLLAEDKQLLFMGKTDSSSFMDRTVELPPSMTKILAVVSAVGIENKVLIEIVDDSVVHYF